MRKSKSGSVDGGILFPEETLGSRDKRHAVWFLNRSSSKEGKIMWSMKHPHQDLFSELPAFRLIHPTGIKLVLSLNTQPKAGTSSNRYSRILMSLGFKFIT